MFHVFVEARFGPTDAQPTESFDAEAVMARFRRVGGNWHVVEAIRRLGLERSDKAEMLRLFRSMAAREDDPRQRDHLLRLARTLKEGSP